MTQDEIIEMAKQAGFSSAVGKHIALDEDLVAFAKLVAQHTLSNIDPSKFMSYQEGMEAGRLAEREACADIAENWNSNGMPRTGVANEIRARGQA